MRDLGLRVAPDHRIFAEARRNGYVILSKDIDFVELVTRSVRHRRATFPNDFPCFHLTVTFWGLEGAGK